jgi:hypothetical protein
VILASNTRRRKRRLQDARLGSLAIALSVIAPASPLVAQRIAPSAVQRLDFIPDALTPADAAVPRERSRSAGAVHGALIGAGAGALTGVAVYIVAHVFVSSQETQVVTSADKPIFFWFATGTGALAGTAIGTLIGGIVGR